MGLCLYMNNSVPLPEVVSTLSVWIGNLVRLQKSIHSCYVFLSRATVIILGVGVAPLRVILPKPQLEIW